MKKQQTKEQKNKKFNIKKLKIKNFPRFIITGTILLCVILISFYYIFLHYSPETIIPYEGYAIQAGTMVKNLQKANEEDIEKTIDLIKVEDQDILFKKTNSYYIGGREKKKIDINYPIYINNNQAILNLSGNTKLITVNYKEVEGYPEFTITGGIMYNGKDLTRADGNEYIFLKSEENIYTNLKEITIKTSHNEYKISENSNIHFEKEKIRYYALREGYIEYKSIEDIDLNSEIKINAKTETYEEFLKKLNIIEEEKQENQEPIQKPEEPKEEPKEETEIQPEEPVEKEEKPTENTPGEVKWVKPEVSCTNFEADVYQARTELIIKDPSGAITSGILFEIEKDGKLYRRTQVISSGLIAIGGLSPDTNFHITGKYTYKDESGEEQEEVFYGGEFTTKKIDTLGTIKLQYENGDIYANKIEFKKLRIENDKNEEVVRGIAKIEIHIDGTDYKMKTSEINQLVQGEEIVYQSGENIESNKTISYQIHIYDKYGNELKVENAKGETRTSKEKPIAKVALKQQDITQVTMSVALTNKDKVKINHYRYVIMAPNGDRIQEADIQTSTKQIELKDLDPNDYYEIKLYGDYDLNDNKGEQKEQIIGEATFTTLPLSSLGYLGLKLEKQEITQDTVKLNMTIDTERTDSRLIKILETIQIQFIPQKDVQKKKDNQEEKWKEDKDKKSYTKTLTKEEIEKLKISEKIPLEFDRLESNTKYKIDIQANVKQGTIQEKVETTYELREVTTLKQKAEVQIKNQFVIGDMIDFDVRIKDPDGAVLTNKVRIEIRNEKMDLVGLEEIGTNQEYERKTYDKLEENKTYTIQFYAPQYNEGSDDSTYKSDYLLKELKILTEPGISGSLDLQKLGRTGTGKNIIDVASKVNWYRKSFAINSGYYYGLKYNDDTKILTIGNSCQGWLKYLYDVSQYSGQEITISFSARSISNENFDLSVCIENKTLSPAFKLTKDWQEYSYTYTIGTEKADRYLGFTISNAYQQAEIKDLQIELGNKKTSYEEFKYILQADMNINLEDRRNEITTNDYYIRIYKNDEQIKEIRYEEIGEENTVQNVRKSYDVDEDAKYKIELLVKIRDRYYTLDTQEFKTEKGKEIKGISTKEEFFTIQPYGEYKILQDIDFSGVSSANIRFGSATLQFEGKIDFNGKTITRDNKSTTQPIIESVGKNGIVENLVLNIKLNSQLESSLNSGTIGTNYGKVSNIKLNLVECNQKPNRTVYLFGGYNYGTIENFIVNLETPLYVQQYSSAMIHYNYGVIQNGYIYGENVQAIKLPSNQNGNYSIGILAGANSSSGIIRNVYSLSSIDFDVENKVGGLYVGNITTSNQSISTVENVYSVGIGKNYQDFNNGPNVGQQSGSKIYNSFYFTDEIFRSQYDRKGNPLSLWDTNFQNQLLNSDGVFKIDELVKQGYYPHLIMPDVMPRQEYIALPEVKDADLPDILSTEVLEQGSQTVKVKFSVNNPAAEQIEKIEIKNLTTNILSQEYADGKSTVIAELTNPLLCVSKYDVLKIQTRGALGITYTREYKEGERKINVDLYKEIWNVEDWKNINKSAAENYMLMTDLDFINEGNSIRLTASIQGIIDGNHHTISNIILDNNYEFISSLTARSQFKNLNIENFQQKATGIGGIISNTSGGTIIDNIHVKNVSITKIGLDYIGGFIRYGTNTILKNSSISNVNINIETGGATGNIYVGGLIGWAANITMENCYVQNVHLKSVNGLNTAAGGIIGAETGISSITNCYATGKIYTEGINAGGIIGRESSSATIIQNCYSKVDISSKNKFVGGIVGAYKITVHKMSNNLSLGNLYSTEDEKTIGRIIGNEITNLQENYAYKNQLMNGYMTNETKGETLLNKEQIMALDLGNAYSYEGAEKGILPKLYNTEKTELLKNQEDISLEEETKLKIERVEVEKPNTTEAQISVLIKNPMEVDITEIEIEDMTYKIERNVTQDGMTNIVIKAEPERYYDSYKITNIKYKIGEEEEEQNLEAKVDVQFYKELYTYEDWQTIEEGTYQNYRLMKDIDFGGKEKDMKKNITVNRLEAENNIYTLKNIQLEFNVGNVGLIQEVRSSMKNIGFKNITIKNTSKQNYCGVIVKNLGVLENLNFDNITILAEEASYIGMIANLQEGEVKNVKLQEIYITGISDIGGLISVVSATPSFDIIITDITGNNITVNATGNYVGGIIRRCIQY